MRTASIERIPTVACITLNWNNHAQTIACLTGLRHWSVGAYRLQVIVVDNHSADFPAALVADAFPAVKIARLPENRGFTGGCNAGAATPEAQASDYLLFLNNDTLVKSDFIAPLVSLLEAEPTVGMVSPVERMAETGTIGAFAVRVDLARGTANMLPPESAPDLTQPRFLPSDSVHGGMMMVRTSLFADLQHFDEAFFAYFEDVDLCLRARRRGFGCGFYISSEVFHLGAGSTRKTDDAHRGNILRACLNRRNSLLLVRKHGTFSQKLRLFSWHLPCEAARFVGKHLIRGTWRHAVRYLAWTALGLFQPLSTPPPRRMLRDLGLRP